ncbi:MAG TPA: DUF2809 domain-containing protein [Ginsengibacter sp.]
MVTFLRFNRKYFIIALAIFTIEVFIALFVHDKIIRPYIGDFLVVILIYCFVKSFLNTPVFPTALAVLLFSYAVEISQYFHLVNKLGLQNSKLARIIFGTYFEWTDLAVYTAGIIAVIFIEGKAVNRIQSK